MTAEELVHEKRTQIVAIAEQFGARNLRVFGSVARGESREDSDIDVLVDWDPGRSLWDHVGLKQALEDLLERRVDVGTARALHWYVRDRILREAVVL
jgi:predicted nucleotidyltransferase